MPLHQFIWSKYVGGSGEYDVVARSDDLPEALLSRCREVSHPRDPPPDVPLRVDAWGLLPLGQDGLAAVRYRLEGHDRAGRPFTWRHVVVADGDEVARLFCPLALFGCHDRAICSPATFTQLPPPPPPKAPADLASALAALRSSLDRETLVELLVRLVSTGGSVQLARPELSLESLQGLYSCLSPAVRFQVGFSSGWVTLRRLPRLVVSGAWGLDAYTVGAGHGRADVAGAHPGARYAGAIAELVFEDRLEELTSLVDRIDEHLQTMRAEPGFVTGESLDRAFRIVQAQEWLYRPDLTPHAHELFAVAEELLPREQQMDSDFFRAGLLALTPSELPACAEALSGCPGKGAGLSPETLRHLEDALIERLERGELVEVAAVLQAWSQIEASLGLALLQLRLKLIVSLLKRAVALGDADLMLHLTRELLTTEPDLAAVRRVPARAWPCAAVLLEILMAQRSLRSGGGEHWIDPRVLAAVVELVLIGGAAQGPASPLSTAKAGALLPSLELVRDALGQEGNAQPYAQVRAAQVVLRCWRLEQPPTRILHVLGVVQRLALAPNHVHRATVGRRLLAALPCCGLRLSAAGALLLERGFQVLLGEEAAGAIHSTLLGTLPDPEQDDFRRESFDLALETLSELTRQGTGPATRAAAAMGSRLVSLAGPGRRGAP